MRSKLNCLLLSIFITSMPLCCYAATYQVDTVAEFNALTLVSGDIVDFNGNNIFRTRIDAVSGVTYTSSTGKAKILGSIDGETTWTDEGSNKYSLSDDSFNDADVSQIFYNTSGLLSEIDVAVEVDEEVELNENWEWFHDIDNSKVIVYHSVGAPNTQAVGIEITKPHTGDGLDGVVRVDNKSNVTISNLELRYGNGYAVKMYGANPNNITINNVDAYYCGGQEISTVTYGGGIQVDGTNVDIVTISNCNASYNWDEGIGVEKSGSVLCSRNNISFINNVCAYNGLRGINVHAFGTNGTTWENIIIRGNTLHSNGTLSYSARSGADGAFIGYSNTEGALDAVTFNDNTIYNNTRKGLYIIGAGDVTVSNNNIYSNGDYGIQIFSEGYESTTGIFFNNIIRDNVKQGLLMTGNSGDLKFINNDFIFNGTSESINSDISIFNTCSGYSFVNNIIETSLYCFVINENSVAGVSLDYNLYNNDSGNMFYFGDYYAGLSEYQSAKSQDTNSLATNPLLDFENKPKYGSPAIDAGTTLSTVTRDIRGVRRPQGSSTDIGAHEHVEGQLIY